MTKHYRTSFLSPLGLVEIISDGQAVMAINFIRKNKGALARHPFLTKAVRQLKEYFRGRRLKFDLPVRLSGTPWQNTVWSLLARIPYGAVSSYHDLAAASGRPKAARALGQAVGTNPLPIIIPCHRVLPSNGSIGWYSGGIDRKIWLLRREGHFDL